MVSRGCLSMKILFLTENFPPETNASATRVYERACFWVRWGHDVTVVTTAPNFPQGRLYEGYRNRWRQTETVDGIRVVRVKSFIAPNRGTVLRMLDFLSFMITGTVAACREARPDVVAATSPQFFAAVAGWLVGALRRVPFVFELGDIWPASIVAVGALKQSLALRMMERFELFLYRRAASVAALTPAFKRNLTRRGIDPSKIAVVINGVDLDRYGPAARDPDFSRAWGIEGAFVVGYVGTHGMAHGLANVLDAAERLRDRPEVRFMLVGDGAERDGLIRSAGERGIDNVVFVPPQPKESMPVVWSVCDVALVHLRDLEAFTEVIPSKTFEAMAMGLPVLLAAPEGEASRILAEDGAGVHVPAEDPDALARAVKDLADDDDRRRALGRQAFESAPRHTRERQAEEMLRTLQLAAEGRGAHAGETPALDSAGSRLT
jgi:glycosyltransferase involved in cell wall biosynthesis